MKETITPSPCCVSAIEDFTKAIEVGTEVGSPNVSLYYNQRGVMQRLGRGFNSAMEDYKKALGIAPAYAQAYYNLGNLEYQLGEQTNDPKKKAGVAHI